MNERNLVLIGLPGSGKSTVGRALADLLGRDFVDLDDRVIERDGRSISEIFAQSGEHAFRELESAAVKEASECRGLVIATGGGCVLREQNVRRLRRHGRMIFLDRTPDQLTPTAGRPLADTREKLARLYRERLPLYREAADLTVDYYAPAELPSPPARVAEHILTLLRSPEEDHPCK